MLSRSRLVVLSKRGIMPAGADNDENVAGNSPLAPHHSLLVIFRTAFMTTVTPTDENVAGGG